MYTKPSVLEFIRTGLRHEHRYKQLLVYFMMYFVLSLVFVPMSLVITFVLSSVFQFYIPYVNDSIGVIIFHYTWIFCVLLLRREYNNYIDLDLENFSGNLNVRSITEMIDHEDKKQRMYGIRIAELRTLNATSVLSALQRASDHDDYKTREAAQKVLARIDKVPQIAEPKKLAIITDEYISFENHSWKYDGTLRIVNQSRYTPITFDIMSDMVSSTNLRVEPQTTTARSYSGTLDFDKFWNMTESDEGGLKVIELIGDFPDVVKKAELRCRFNSLSVKELVINGESIQMKQDNKVLLLTESPHFSLFAKFEDCPTNFKDLMSIEWGIKLDRSFIGMTPEISNLSFDIYYDVYIIKENEKKQLVLEIGNSSDLPATVEKVCASTDTGIEFTENQFTLAPFQTEKFVLEDSLDNVPEVTTDIIYTLDPDIVAGSYIFVKLI